MSNRTRSMPAISIDDLPILQPYIVEASHDDTEFIVFAPGRSAVSAVIRERARVKNLTGGARRVVRVPMAHVDGRDTQ